MTSGALIASQETARALGGFAAATLYEAIGKIGGLSAEIRPILPRPRMAGIAYTVRILGAETLAVLRAVEAAPADSVLIIDCGSVGTSPVWGGTSSLVAKLRGLAGCVTNGCVRDVEEIIEHGVPVYAGGVCVIGTLKNHLGWVGVPVSLGGVTVQAGDYVIGDSDGVVVVPAAEGVHAVELAAIQRKKEVTRETRLRAGESLASVLGLSN